MDIENNNLSGFWQNKVKTDLATKGRQNFKGILGLGFLVVVQNTENIKAYPCIHENAQFAREKMFVRETGQH